MKFDYINTVLSHIADRQKREKIESELFDHIDEKEQQLEKIGYGEAEAFKKANEAMGDGDTVGEQLDIIGSRRSVNIFSGILVVLVLLNIPFYFIMAILEYKCVFGYIFTFETVSIFVSFIIYAANILFGISKNKVLNLFASLLIYPTSILSQGIIMCMNKLIRGGLMSMHYMDVTGKNELLSNTILCLELLSIVFAIIDIAVIIRTHRLKNTRRDLKLKHISKAVLTVTTILFAIIVIPAVIISPVKASDIAKETETVNTLIIKNAAEFENCKDENDLKKWVENTLGSYAVIVDNAYLSEGDGVLAKTDSYCTDIKAFVSTDGSTLNVSTCSYYNDYYFLEELGDVDGKATPEFLNSDGEKSVDDASMLCELDMEKSESGNITLTLTYYNSPYDDTISAISIIWKYQNGEFVFSDFQKEEI